jgi:hypothetical protein
MLLQEQGEKRGRFTVFTRVMEEEWDGLPGYSARLRYPELHGGATPEACEELNHVFKGRCFATLQELRSNRFDQHPSLWTDKKEFGIATYKTIKDYKIIFLSDSAFSMTSYFEIYTGGAHENYLVVTDTIALQPVSSLQLYNFFKTECDYWGILGLQAREALKKQAWERSRTRGFSPDIFDQNEDWLLQGTNFKENTKIDFTFSEAGLTLYFSPYQVAAFAFGSWEVTLPYYDLREILRPNGLHELFLPSS